MEKQLYENYLEILKSELIPALGCTEPIAVAYASAKARSILGCFPESAKVSCSGNIVKNVKGVLVPNSNGLKGIDAAAILGIIGGDADNKLEVLENVTKDDIEKTISLLNTNYCTCELVEGVENLYVSTTVYSGVHYVEVTISHTHTSITRIIKDGEVIFDLDDKNHKKSTSIDKSKLNIKDIYEYATNVDINDVKEILDLQIKMNTAISLEGLNSEYGAEIGRTLIKCFGDDIKNRAIAKTAAGSDARMNGCPMPVVINSGSGNQGMTVTIPVVEYAKELKCSKEKLYRALIISNLISIHIKRHIGSLSAFCGAVTAASGAGAAITYLSDGSYDDMCRTITNTLANVGGIVCDGAKSSCAAKIAASVNAAIMGHYLSINNRSFNNGEGIVENDIEDTIKNIGHIGKVGMKTTDTEILNIMIGNKS